MVCLGNICRSPLAEGIMQSISDKRALGLEVDSAGTSNFHIGQHPDIRSAGNALTHGVDISKSRARQFEVDDFDYFDRIYAMDTSNYNDIISLARDKDDEDKVDKILSVLNPGKPTSVPDPYYGGEMGFENIYTLLEEACEKITAELS